MQKGYKVTLGVLTIMILLTITVGTSYSYYQVSDKQTTANTLATGCFKINFKDGNNGSISLASDKFAFPIDETSLNENNYYEFTLENTCTNENSMGGVKYEVLLSDETVSNNLPLGKIKYKLIEGTTSANTVTGKLLSNATKYTSLPSNMADYGINTSHNIYKMLDNGPATMNAQGTKTYKLYLWIDSDAGNEVMGQTFTGQVFVYAYM